MASPALTVASQLQCPHGAKVAVIPASTRVSAGAPLVTADDVWSVAGCTNTPSCTTVRWTVTDQKVTVNGSATLSTTSVGSCLAGTVDQGLVVILATQGNALTS